MANVLILKLGASGDVVRTTPVLRRLSGVITWLTAAKNRSLVEGLRADLHCVSWEEREAIRGRDYDLVINLEDTMEAAEVLRTCRRARMFGAYLDGSKTLRYTDDSSGWFDLGLISVHGRRMADQLKVENRRTYQELLFEGLGFPFQGEPYLVPDAPGTGLQGDVAIATEAGSVWPMKNWAYYAELQRRLEAAGLKVNRLPIRSSLLEHLGDVQGHRCLVSGDSLPMHLALGSQIRCVTLFTCTSPWEIHDYGIQTKLVSPLLVDFFYQRGFDPRATTAISVEEVFRAVLDQLDRADQPAPRSPRQLTGEG